MKMDPSLHQKLREEVCHANRLLGRSGLVCLTWGNVSGFDPSLGQGGCMAIKPSGVPYEELLPEQMVVLDLEGQILYGDLRPSSDTPTHLVFYREFRGIGGVTHTHSRAATAFSQAGKSLPCLGTTHADHFRGTVPVARALTSEETLEGYEHMTGRVIVDRFRELGLDPLHMPAVFQHYHAPFTWGKNALKSLENAVALEECARLALETWSLMSDRERETHGGLPEHLLSKHFDRKHGPSAYYGQPA